MRGVSVTVFNASRIDPIMPTHDRLFSGSEIAELRDLNSRATRQKQPSYETYTAELRDGNSRALPA
jgi:hypothetical protein